MIETKHNFVEAGLFDSHALPPFFLLNSIPPRPESVPQNYPKKDVNMFVAVSCPKCKRSGDPNDPAGMVAADNDGLYCLIEGCEWKRPWTEEEIKSGVYQGYED